MFKTVTFSGSSFVFVEMDTFTKTKLMQKRMVTHKLNYMQTGTGMISHLVNVS